MNEVGTDAAGRTIAGTPKSVSAGLYEGSPMTILGIRHPKGV
jgi:hypothetical protein